MSRIAFSSAAVGALGAALLFGAGTPLAKQLLHDTSPVMLAGLLYLGSGMGFGVVHAMRDRSWRAPAPISRRHRSWVRRLRSWHSANMPHGCSGQPPSLGTGAWLHPIDRHEHLRTHEPITHNHPHYPDIHHQHRHE